MPSWLVGYWSPVFPFLKTEDPVNEGRDLLLLSWVSTDHLVAAPLSDEPGEARGNGLGLVAQVHEVLRQEHSIYAQVTALIPVVVPIVRALPVPAIG